MNLPPVKTTTTMKLRGNENPLRVAIGGLGTIGKAVATRLDAGIDGLSLTAVSAQNVERAEQYVRLFKNPAPVVRLTELADHADIVVECAPAAVFSEVAEAAIARGCIFIPSSIGALLDHWHLIAAASQSGARINAPTGALLGLDAVRAAAEGTIHRVSMITRKPPAGLAGSPHLQQNKISIEGLTEAVRVFKGSAQEGIKGFPANVNVAVALGLAGIGPERTELEIWADPGVVRNTHCIEVEADSARFELKIESIPSVENPRTGRIVALSVIATLRRLVQTFTVGT